MVKVFYLNFKLAFVHSKSMNYNIKCTIKMNNYEWWWHTIFLLLVHCESTKWLSAVAAFFC